MKKIIVSLACLLLIASCQSKSEVETAKQELLENTEVENQISQDDTSTGEDSNLSGVDSDSLVQIIQLDSDSLLDFNEISEDSIAKGEVVIGGVAQSSVDKIEVLFSNSSSTYSDDSYTLQTYRKGEGDFKYIASSNNKVLDFGINEYIFRAYSGVETNDTKVILRLPSSTPSKEIGLDETKLIGGEDDSLLIDLPTSSKYGEPIMMGEDSFTYSQIKGFEVKKEILPVLSCEEITDYLTDRMNVWYYWNTCRDIVKEKAIRFNVIRLDGEEYVYERHYVDYSKGLYGIYELERGVGVDKDNIKEKNDELKESEFPVLDIVDDLVRDIVTS